MGCPLGKLYISYLIGDWNSKMSVRELLIKLRTVFHVNNPESPFGMDRADEFRYNSPLFEKKVSYFTQKYANLINSSQNYDKWDFTITKKMK